jgi:hypothetical protein
MATGKKKILKDILAVKFPNLVIRERRNGTCYIEYSV